MKKTSSLMTLMFCFLLICARSNGADWPQWRGPRGQGHADAENLPLVWSEDKNVSWKTELIGVGHSSPVIEGDRVWLTTGIDQQASENEKEERLKANTGNQPLVVSDLVSLRALCVDLKSGKVLHDIELMTEKDPQWVHALNSYASPTPIIRNGKLYCHFGTYGTACLDTGSGKVLWTNREQRVMHENGPGSTPVLWNDLLIFHCDGSDKQYIVALDSKTGIEAWKTKRSGEMNENPQLQKSYSTPLIVNIGGRDQLMSPAADWLYAYDPQTGKELWKLRYGLLGFSNVPRPVFANGMIYLSTGFMKAEMLAIRLNKTGSTVEPEISWRYKKQVPTIPSPLLVGDELYFVSNNGIATCLDAKTGEVNWIERLGGNFAASPTFADGRVYFFNRDGETFVLAPGPEFNLLAKNKLDSGFMASAAAVDGAFILRTESALYRIES